VTVIIPLYNKRGHLDACLESVRHQAGIALEMICVDDFSSDRSGETAEAVARTEPRLRLIRNDSHRGAAYSRNLGISLARGRYLQFTDADDMLPPDSLGTLLQAADRSDSEVARGSLQAVAGGVVAPGPAATIKAERIGPLLDMPELWIPWFHVCFLISRALVVREKIQYPDLVAGEDPVFLAAVLTKANRICVTPRATYTWRPNDRRPRASLRTVQDYIEHARRVKTIYSGTYEACWVAYRGFIADNIRLLLSQADVTSEESQALENEIRALQ
jgi:glycosyltransferase involved in cell wall biosynthesis